LFFWFFFLPRWGLFFGLSTFCDEKDLVSAAPCPSSGFFKHPQTTASPGPRPEPFTVSPIGFCPSLVHVRVCSSFTLSSPPRMSPWAALLCGVSSPHRERHSWCLWFVSFVHFLRPFASIPYLCKFFELLCEKVSRVACFWIPPYPWRNLFFHEMLVSLAFDFGTLLPPLPPPFL